MNYLNLFSDVLNIYERSRRIFDSPMGPVMPPGGQYSPFMNNNMMGINPPLNPMGFNPYYNGINQMNYVRPNMPLGGQFHSINQYYKNRIKNFLYKQI